MCAIAAFVSSKNSLNEKLPEKSGRFLLAYTLTKIKDCDKIYMANNRLPFGLCKQYGIKLPKNATPKDAWEALDKIPANEFKKSLIVKVPLDYFSEKGINKLSSSEIKKGIKTQKKRLKEHLKKIESPELYCNDWNSRTRAAKLGLINFWQKECANLERGIHDRLTRLKELGEHYEEDD